MKAKAYIFVTFLLFGIINAEAQQLRFDRFDLSNGLSQNNINCMEFDQSGNLWLGTLDGVNQYNGYRFTIFKPNRSDKSHLVGNYVTCMGVGLADNMWFITRGGGLNYFKADRQHFELVDPEVFGRFNLEQTGNIVETSDSLLWLNNGSILGVWKTGTNRFYTLQKENSIRGIRNLSSNSVLVFGDFGIQQIKFDIGQKRFDTKTITSKPCFGIASKDDRWLAILNEGIFPINQSGNVGSPLIAFSATPFANINKSNINDFTVIENAFWIGGNGFLVQFNLNNGKLGYQQFKNNPLNDYSFKGYSVTRLLKDKLGNLWIGTAKNGLLHLNHQKNQFQHYSWKIESATDPESNPVRAICKAQNGNLWLGFDAEGVALLKHDASLKYYRDYYTLNNNQRRIQNVRVIFEDSRGNIWVGANNSLCIFNRKSGRFESVNCQFSWSWPYRCYVIKEFELGMVTLTSPTNIGIVNLDDGSLTTIPVKVKGTSTFQSVRDIVQDKYRNLWLALDNVGLLEVTYPDLEYKFIQSSNTALSDDKAYCLLATGDSLWIGTNGGLNLLNLKTNKIEAIYFEDDGLSNDIIYSISKDREGVLWMSTNRGISSYDPKLAVFKTFLSNDYFMDDAYFVNASGTIYYGGYTGVVSFQPEKITTIGEDIRPGLESLAVFNQKVFPGDTIDGRVLLNRELSKTKEIDFSYRQHTFSLGFNAYPFDYPNTHRFRYRLKNYQQNWTEGNGSRLATYTKVPPGNYTFQLQVAPFNNQFGNTLELEIRVIPPIWMTTGFKIFVVVFIILVVGILFQIRVQQVKQRNAWLQQKVNEQTTELREQNRKILEISEQLHEADQSKLRFFTNISHEFRTPLTLIIGHLENLSSDSKQAVNSIRKNAVRLLKLINQLIDLRKMDQDQLNLSVSEFELMSVLNETLDSFRSMADQKNIALRMDSTINELPVWLDMDKMEKILYNLLSNALKYSPKGKSVFIKVEEQEAEFRIDIVDQGIGIPKNELQTIFDRFHRTVNSQLIASGHGIGLSMVKGLTEIQQGKINVKSEEGKGSTFSLIFKKGNEHFKSADFGEQIKEELAVELDEKIERISIEKIGRKKVLVVEDHQELAAFIENVLAPSLDIKIAGNGKEAMDVLANYAPDLIISDVMMPLMDGIQFCETVKGAIETSHIPFILLSAKTDVETQVDGLETGADDYMEKPFRPRILLAKVNSLLANREKLKALFMKMPGKINTGNELNSRDRDFLKNVNDLIDENLGDSTFSIERLSSEVNMSRTTFYRKFSDLTGIKPSDYIRRYRLKTAHNLLSSSGKSVQEVCEMVGFQSDSHFRKCFKDEFGVTPSKVQKG